MKCEFTFVVTKSKAKQPWHWVCKAANGQIKFHSENYVSRGSCLNSIKQLTKYFRPGLYTRTTDG